MQSFAFGRAPPCFDLASLSIEVVLKFVSFIIKLEHPWINIRYEDHIADEIVALDPDAAWETLEVQN